MSKTLTFAGICTENEQIQKLAEQAGLEIPANIDYTGPYAINNPMIGFYGVMINDRWRNEFFYNALQTKSKDKIVLDMGTGTGILAFYALAAGAKFVYCVELNPSSAQIAKKILSKNFSEDRFAIINADFWSTDLTKIINHPIDILVSETVGSGLFDQGMIHTWNKIQSYLAPGAISIPDRLHCDLWVWDNNITVPFDQIHILYPSEMIDLNFAKSLLEVDKELNSEVPNKNAMKWIDLNRIQTPPVQKYQDVVLYTMQNGPKLNFTNNKFHHGIEPEISFTINLKENSTVAIVNKISFEDTTLYLKDALFMPWTKSPFFVIQKSGNYQFKYANFDLTPLNINEWGYSIKD
jgi:predicted RNA methylase